MDATTSSFGSNALAKTAQDNYAAHGKTGDRSQSQSLCNLRVDVEQVAKERRQRKKNSQYVQPRRRSRRLCLIAVLQAKLQQDRGQSDRAHHHHRQRAEECPAVGEQHDEGQRSAKQTGGNHRPAARMENGRVQFSPWGRRAIVDTVRRDAKMNLRNPLPSR